MNWGELHSIFDYGFLRRAVLAAILMSLTCGLIAPVVVLRRLSFSTDGLAHSSLGGLAIGVIFVTNGASPSLISYLISFIFTVSVAAGITYLSENSRIDSDTAVEIEDSNTSLSFLVRIPKEGYSKDVARRRILQWRRMGLDVSAAEPALFQESDDIGFEIYKSVEDRVRRAIELDNRLDILEDNGWKSEVTKMRFRVRQLTGLDEVEKRIDELI